MPGVPPRSATSSSMQAVQTICVSTTATAVSSVASRRAWPRAGQTTAARAHTTQPTLVRLTASPATATSTTIAPTPTPTHMTSAQVYSRRARAQAARPITPSLSAPEVWRSMRSRGIGLWRASGAFTFKGLCSSPHAPEPLQNKQERTIGVL